MSVSAGLVALAVLAAGSPAAGSSQAPASPCDAATDASVDHDTSKSTDRAAALTGAPVASMAKLKSQQPPLIAQAAPPAAPVPAPAAAPPPSAPAAAPDSPALDLASLEQRLRDTRAIGVFTKLSIKNQVDDLLDDFRAFHRGEAKIRLTELRDKYELLIVKVITLLQDADPLLAKAVLSSREAIWSMLTDPAKFATI